MSFAGPTRLIHELRLFPLICCVCSSDGGMTIRCLSTLMSRPLYIAAALRPRCARHRGCSRRRPNSSSHGYRCRGGSHDRRGAGEGSAAAGADTADVGSYRSGSICNCQISSWSTSSGFRDLISLKISSALFSALVEQKNSTSIGFTTRQMKRDRSGFI